MGNSQISSKSHFEDLMSDKNLAALKIQKYWRLKKNRFSKKQSTVELLTATISNNLMMNSHTKFIEGVLRRYDVSYHIVDLTFEERKLPKWQNNKLPLVLVDNICVGNRGDLLSLESAGILEGILKGKFQQYCLVCNSIRKDRQVCPYCQKPYQFFECVSASKTKIDLQIQTPRSSI